MALEEWVRTGAAPPPSRVPSIAQGTAVVAEAVEMPPVPGFAPAAGANRIGPPVDWVEPPSRLDNFYETRVCAVDADGNEVAGIRLPPIAVPLGTYTGWNVYRAHPCELCDRDGCFFHCWWWMLRLIIAYPIRDRSLPSAIRPAPAPALAHRLLFGPSVGRRGVHVRIAIGPAQMALTAGIRP